MPYFIHPITLWLEFYSTSKAASFFLSKIRMLRANVHFKRHYKQKDFEKARMILEQLKDDLA